MLFPEPMPRWPVRSTDTSLALGLGCRRFPRTAEALSPFPLTALLAESSPMRASETLRNSQKGTTYLPALLSVSPARRSHHQNGCSDSSASVSLSHCYQKCLPPSCCPNSIRMRYRATGSVRALSPVAPVPPQSC